MEKSTVYTVGFLLLIAHLLYCFRSPIGATTVVDCPHGCVCINASSHVTCDGTGLTAIPVDRLPVSVTSLDLCRNELAVVDSLRGLSRLVELRLCENSIEVFGSGELDYVAGTLEMLDLSRNNMTKLEPGALNVATHLLHVDLSGNQLNDVDGAFDGLSELSRLDLRQNRLMAITSNTLSGLSSLRYLRLDDNQISVIDRQAFSTLDRLMYLVLRGNPLGGVSRFHFSSGFLSYVDLSDCDLERFPMGLPHSVRYLQLRHNRLWTLSRQDLADVAAELNILILDENQLERIDDDAFVATTNLQQMWLNGNRLVAIPRSLPVTLQRLFVDFNRLESLTAEDFPSSPSGRWQLATLSAMSNNISFVGSDALSGLSQLSSLDLAANRLRTLYADTFAGNGRLHSLVLSKNPLEVFGARCLEGLNELETLSLAYIPSKEVTVSEDTFGEYLPHLRKLDLTSSPGLVYALMDSDRALTALGAVQDLVLLGSELEALSDDFPDVFPGLAVLHLSSTRWRCDSSMLWFRNWLLSAAIHLEPERDQIVCASPARIRGRALISLGDEDFEQADKTRVMDRPVRRRRPPSPVAVQTSTSSLSTSPQQSHDRGPLIWEELLSRMSTLYEDVVEVDSNHETTHLSRRSFISSTPSGAASAASSKARARTASDDRVMLIIVMTILVTVLAAVAILAVIVYTCRHQPYRRPTPPTRTTTGNGSSSIAAQNGCVVPGSKTGRDVVYFVANGSRSPQLDKSKLSASRADTVVEMNDVDHHHRVTLLRDRDGKNKGPLRVYKWEDF